MSGNGTTILKYRSVEALVLALVVGVIAVIGPRWLNTLEDAPRTAQSVEELAKRTAEARADREKIRKEWKEQRRETQMAIQALTNAVTDLRLEVQHFRSTIPFLVPGTRPSDPRAAENDFHG